MRDNIGIGGENSASAGRGGAGVDREQFMSQLRQDSKMRRVEHLRAQPHKERVQAMRRGEHLRAQPPKKQMQGLPAKGGLVLATKTEFLVVEVGKFKV
jgi:hypothetical protein